MKKFVGTLLCILAIIGICGCKKADTIEEVTEIKSPNAYSCMYQEQEHKFNVFLPEEEAQSRPVIIMLHGYGNTAESFASQTHFEKAACEKGYIVAYVTSTPDSKGYIGWNSGLDESDKDDVAFLKALAAYLQKEYQGDPKRTFAVGFSNGAFMTQRLAVDAPETFTAIASVAGMMPESVWQSKKEKAGIGVLEIYGTKDDVVPMKANGSDKTSKAPAIEDVMDYWASANQLSDKTEEVLSDKSVCTKYSGKKQNEFVWSVVIADGRHSWPDASYAGFQTNDLILEFFDQYSK